MPNLSTESKQIGELFRQPKPLAVPRFQRDFSWDREKVEQLWADTWTSINGDAETYFLGSIVVKNTPSATVAEVIDGQQRLTSISLLICALRDALRSNGATACHTAATNLTNFYLSDSGYDLGGEEMSPKLTPNQTNRSFYEENILSGGNVEALRELARSRKIHKSNKLMAQAYLYFRDSITAMGLSSTTLIEVANKVAKAIDNRLQVIVITVADDYDAYLLFETLNDRGLALLVADLLKNYIFSKADNRLEDVQDYWQKMLDYLQSVETKRYLRHHWLSQVGVVREKELYKEIKDKYKDKAAVVKFAKDLRDGAQIYGALSDKDSELWSMFDAPQRRLITKDIEELSIFNVNQYNPLLLSTLAKAPELSLSFG